MVVELDKVLPNDSHLSKPASCASLTLGNGLMSNILDVFLLNKHNEQLWNGCFFALHFIIYNTQVGGWGKEKLVSHFQFVCVILASFVVAGTKLPPPLGSRRYWTSKLSSFPPYLAFSISSLILFLHSICSAYFCQISIFSRILIPYTWYLAGFQNKEN